MAAPLDHEDQPSTVQTRVWVDEHDWLFEIFKSARNTAPRFRLSDLLSACISITLRDSISQRDLICYLDQQLTSRNPRTERRTCHVFSRQFDQLLAAHRAAWNSAPNPMFELDHLATACVAVAKQQPDPIAGVLKQARTNFLARSATDGRRLLSN